MSEQSDLWNRTIMQLHYASNLLKDCAEQCTKAMHASQDSIIALEKARDLKCTVCPMDNLEDL